MEFGETLKHLREKRELSRYNLAESLKISYSAISKYETNVRFPDKDTLHKIADYFDVSIDYLLGRTDTRNSNKTGIEAKPHNSLDVSNLPEEAVKQVEEYIEFLKQKYNSDENLKKK